jgi:hypothetical protein
VQQKFPLVLALRAHERVRLGGSFLRSAIRFHIEAVQFHSWNADEILTLQSWLAIRFL